MARTVLAAALAWSLAAAVPCPAQEPAAPPASAEPPPAAAPEAGPAAAPTDDDVERIIVEGRAGGITLHDFVLDFVADIGDPTTPDNGYARWRDHVCVGVQNAPVEPAQFIADRIGDVARGLGLDPGDPGCRPNLYIMFTNDGAKLATYLVENNGRAFRPYGGVGGTTQGLEALGEFETSDAPVRWWQVTMVVDDTGNPALVLPDSLYGPPTVRGANSHITNSVQDEIWATFVIVDASKAQGKTWAQIADYLAYVTLAQVDPHGTASGYDSILNLFTSDAPPDGLTAWDESYLRALYQLDTRRMPRIQKGELVNLIMRDLKKSQE